MSTFLVGLVVAAATVIVLRVALSDPDQPATIRRTPSRARPRRPPATRRHRATRGHPPAARAWVRVRSGLALVILVTFVGVLMALTTGAGLALAARALRQAVG